MSRELPAKDHAALMDLVYRRQRYVYDLTRKYYLFGRDRLIHELALKPGERLVEVGCGTARNLVRIARLYPDAELFGLDASQEMLKSAADRAVFSYSLSMIPDWRRALVAAGSALSKTGSIHVVDFGDLTGLGRVGASCLRGWLSLFHVEPRVEILHGVERQTAGNLADDGALWVSPARYAFLWTCSKVGAEAFALTDVADR
jgi:S-adenosylmethionine-diacylgycerolhomoserine-N-methlytransferase